MTLTTTGVKRRQTAPSRLRALVPGPLRRVLEEIDALKNLEEILEVDDVDVFFVAPSDLSQTMGHIGDAGHPDVQKAIDDALARIVARGRVPGTLVNEANIADYIHKGVRFTMTSWNGWVARGAAEFLEKAAKARA